MPFCTTCGKEVEPGKKFCEYCGTPLEQPASPTTPATPSAVPAAPVLPQPVPAAASGGSGKTIIIAGILIVLVLVAGIYFIGLPMINKPPPAGSTLPQTTSIPMQPLTPIPTTVFPDIPNEPVSAGTPAASQTYEEKYTETYNQVYAINRAFVGGQKESFSQDLTAPPLYIKFNITPKIEEGEKVDDVGKMVSTSYVSPNAWFKVNIYDAGNGAIVEQQGFNKGFSITTNQEFMVRAPGSYRVEISGNDVIAEVRILTGRS